MPEERFFFGDAPRLYGCLHHPDAAPDATPLLYVHPFAEEHLFASRASVEFARRLAGAGVPAMRFDARGSGDSEGDLVDLDAAAWLADVGRAVDELRRRTGATRVDLWGLRLGAAVAILAAESRRDVRALLLWEPALEPRAFFDALFRQLRLSAVLRRDAAPTPAEALAALERGEPVGLRGEVLSPAVYRSLATLAPESARPRVERALIVAIEKGASAEPARRLAGALRDGGADADVELVGAQPFWTGFRHRDPAPFVEASLRAFTPESRPAT